MAQQSWTNDPITAGQTRVVKKSVHFTELQDAINAWETAYSIGNTGWTDSPAAMVKIKTTAITEMQDALDALYQLTDSSDFTWTVPTATSSILPDHVNEVRTNMNTMQNSKCYQCDLCDSEVGCTCDSTCYNDACDQCDSSCYGYSACSCNATCYGYSACSLCHGTCYLEGKHGCFTCNFTCHAGYSACSCNLTCHGDSACTCNSSCNSDQCDLCDSSCNSEPSCTKCHVVNYRYPWT